MDSISNVLNSAYTDPALKHVFSVLDSTASFPQSDESSGAGHRAVRSQVERGILDRAGAILDQLRPLSSAVDLMGNHISRAVAVHNEMRAIIEPYNAQLNEYARKAELANAEAERVARSERTLEAFMQSFYISEEVKSSLNGPELDDKFFESLNRVRDIHSNGAVALLAEAPSAGELLMYKSSKLLDIAYQKIKNRVEQELHTGSTTNLRRYMALLAERPLLFKSVLSGESEARSSRITRDFAQFVSREHENSLVLPANYLSSMLAWIHSAIVNEFEHISLLFDDKTENQQLEQLLDASDTKQVIAELVNLVLAAVESQIRQKITALVVAQTSLAVLDELQNILVFYEGMLTSQFGKLPVLDVLTQLNSSITQQFGHLLEIQAPTWEQRVDTARCVVITHDKGLGSLIAEERVAKLLKRQEQGSHISELNAIDYAVTHLAGFTTAQDTLDELMENARTHESAQVDIEVEEMRKRSGLEAFVGGKLSAREFGLEFDQFLGSFDSQSRLSDLESPTIARRIAEAAVQQFVDSYELASRELPQLRSAEEVKAVLS